MNAYISPEAARRVTKLAELPAGDVERISEWLWGLLISLAGIAADDEARPKGTRTRLQFLRQVEDLRRAAAGEELPAVPPWLAHEIAFELRRDVVKPPRSIDPSEGPMLSRRLAEVDEFYAVALTDVAKLRVLLDRVAAILKTRRDFTREFYEAKRAFNPRQHLVLSNCVQFWTNRLGRPASVTGAFVAFTDAVLRIAAIEMSPEAVKRRLHMMITDTDR